MTKPRISLILRLHNNATKGLFMFDYCHIDDDTGFSVAHERFTVKAMRGDDIDGRESYSFHITGGDKIKEVLQLLEEDGFIDYLQEFHESGCLQNTPCQPGQVKIVTGRLEFSECGDVLKFKNVKWSDPL